MVRKGLLGSSSFGKCPDAWQKMSLRGISAKFKWLILGNPSQAHYFPGQEGKVDKSSQWVVLHPTVCVCPLVVLRQVSDLVLIDPIPEDIFEEDKWKEYWWVCSGRLQRTESEEEKKVKMQRREREDGNMSKKQKLGRDVEWERRLRKEERGKGSEKDDNSSEGQRGGR